MTTDGTYKFATYFRDSWSGLEYADQRYYASGLGRFLTADPYVASGGVGNPGSWNRYSYVQSDPVNSFDPGGLFTISVGGVTWSGNDPASCAQWMGSMSAMSAQFQSTLGSGGIQAVMNACQMIPAAIAGGMPPSPPAAWKCPERYQNYIGTYGSYAAATGLSEANVLALSSIESGWGIGRFATDGHSFFNFETVWTEGTEEPGFVVNYQTGWTKANKSLRKNKDGVDQYSLVAAFANDSDSFKSFGESEVGKALRGVSNPTQFGQIANGEGYTPAQIRLLWTARRSSLSASNNE